MKRVLGQGISSQTCPVFYVFTPDIVHFAPYCIEHNAAGFTPIVILNSISDSDRQWMQMIFPNVLMIRLHTSLSGNPRSILSHGQVIDLLFKSTDRPFCIQDPDCFVLDPDFWTQVHLDKASDLAAGPFVTQYEDRDHIVPRTYFMLFNTHKIRQIFESYGINADATARINRKTLNKIGDIGYGRSRYPQSFKGYFDTLQLLWILGFAEEKRFKVLDGAGSRIVHIGGTSYLHKSDYEISHWDYWPLSVIYMNLWLLEQPFGARFRKRFEKIFDEFGSSERLLQNNPEFKQGWRYKEMQKLLSYLEPKASTIKASAV